MAADSRLAEVFGLSGVDPWITACGLAVQKLGKLWFLDRMALLYTMSTLRVRPTSTVQSEKI